MNKKAINFDLDTKKLREFHPKGITQAYTDIRNFLESMGFEHRQGSGYVSKEPMGRSVKIEKGWLCFQFSDKSKKTDDFYSILNILGFDIPIV